MRGLVRLVEPQVYGGCVGAVVSEPERGVHVVLLSGVGRVVRLSSGLEPYTSGPMPDPRAWHPSRDARIARAAVMRAVKRDDLAAAAMYADEAIEAEGRIPCAQGT